MLEKKVFQLGIGHLATSSRLFMYGRFIQHIGTVVDLSLGAGPTDLVKVQFDRVARSKRGPANKKRSQGYFVYSHGYPISSQKLHSDFPSGAAAVLNLQLQP